ncbi:hypothetical protein ACI76X_09805 [Capnocytophaga canimorsus]
MKFFKLKNLPIIVFVLIVIGLFVNTFIKSKQCFQNAYYLVIDQVEDGGRGTKMLYSKGKQIILTPYDPVNIKMGDSISKDSCATYVYFYRKDSLGNYYEFTKLEPTYIYPRSWFCNE